MTRKLIYCVISNDDTYYNFEKSVLMKKFPAYWGFTSTAQKLHKMFNKIEIGDILLFSKNKQVKYIGIVTHLYCDPNKGKQIGWKQKSNQFYDLIVEFKKIEVNIENILDYIGWSRGTPNGAAIINQKINCDKFWKTFGQIINDSNIKSQIINQEELNEKNDAFAYIFGWEDDGPEGPVRIGESNNLNDRLDSHDCGTYHNLVVYHKEISPSGNGRDLEQRVHKMLSKHRIAKKHWRTGNKKQTEWFKISAQEAKQVMIEEATKLKIIHECR